MKLKNLLKKTVIPSVIIVVIVLILLCPFSCVQCNDSPLTLVGNYKCLTLEDFSVNSSDTLEMSFNRPANVEEAIVRELSSSKDISTNVEQNEESNCIQIKMNEDTSIGKKYKFNAVIVDPKGNSLTLEVPFNGYNNNVAKLLMTEVRNGYSGSKDSKYWKVEFVEFYVLKSGNLSGLEIVSASDGEEMKYEFPGIDVKKGEYITVFCRSSVNNGTTGTTMFNETGSNLSLSTHPDSTNNRELISENTKAVFATSDIIMLKDTNSNCIMDCFVYCKSSVASWNDKFSIYVKQIEKQGLWQKDGKSDCSPYSAYCSDSLTSSITRTFSRQNVDEIISLYNSSSNDNEVFENSKDVWLYVSGSTPGSKNSTTAYVSSK